MRRLALAASVLLLTSAAASAANDPQILAPVQKFIDAFNKGDVAGAAATHSATDDLVIIDEVPPYVWHGAKAFDAWANDLAAYDKQNGITDEAVAISAPTRVEATADKAYVIVPAVYTFKQNGANMRAASQMTLVLRKGAGGWLIHGWTWTGPKPKAAAPAKP
jgi:ketosteroid isomerase-like protein